MKSIIRHSVRSFAFYCLITAAPSLTFVTDAFRAAQNKERAIQIEKHATAPLQFDDILLSGQSIKGQAQLKKKNARAELQEIKLNAVDTWLKDIKINVRNVSDKPITAFSLEWWITHPALEVPTVVKMSRDMRVTGRDMALNEIVQVESTEKGYQAATKLIKDKDSAGSITTATLKLSTVLFKDGTMWALGSIFQQDPANDKRWIKIKDKRSPAGST